MTERRNFFNDGDPHPKDCDCHAGEHGVKVHGGVCHIANVGTWVPESELENRLHPDWKRQADLGTKSYDQLVSEHRTKNLAVRIEALRNFPASAEEHRQELQRLRCFPWCKWFNVEYDHDWCEPKWEWKDYEKSENAIEGRLRRAEELIEYDKQDDIICCFGTHVSCTCKDFYPDRDPNCPLKQEHERMDKR
jgi:hypothetical protein